MIQISQDNDEPKNCSKCMQNRYCRVFECQQCKAHYCYYCLVDEQKRVLLGLIDENFDQNDIADQPIVFGSDSTNDS